MPLLANTNYEIRNDLTDTVLNLSGTVVCGWGWKSGPNLDQNWKLTSEGGNKWKLQNQGAGNPFLSRQENATHRLVGGLASDAHHSTRTDFTIQRILGRSDKYRILHEGLAVTLVTGQNVPEVNDANKIFDLHADGPPIALQAVADTTAASIWSFIPFVQQDRPPLVVGEYQIVNSRTGTAFDFANVNANAQAQCKTSADNQKWTITRNAQNGYYTFQRRANRLLAPAAGTPADGAALNATDPGARFTIRKVPHFNLYKIFYDSDSTGAHPRCGLAVNLPVQNDGKPNSTDGAVVTLRTAEAQTWAFV